MSLNTVLNAIVWFPWALLAIGGPVMVWWLFEPVPVEVTYVAPSFLAEPVKTREESTRVYISEAQGGSTIYRYVEFCVRRPFNGTSHRKWVNPAMVWHAPDVSTHLSRSRGCSFASIPIEVPTSNPTRRFEFVQWMEIQTNPIRTDVVEYPPIPLTILRPK